MSGCVSLPSWPELPSRGARRAILAPVSADNIGDMESGRDSELSTIDLLERLSDSQRESAEYAYKLAETYEVILQASGNVWEPRTFSA